MHITSYLSRHGAYVIELRMTPDHAVLYRVSGLQFEATLKAAYEWVHANSFLLA